MPLMLMLYRYMILYLICFLQEIERNVSLMSPAQQQTSICDTATLWQTIMDKIDWSTVSTCSVTSHLL